MYNKKKPHKHSNIQLCKCDICKRRAIHSIRIKMFISNLFGFVGNKDKPIIVTRELAVFIND